MTALDDTLGDFDGIGEELEWAEVLGQVVLLLAQKDAGVVPVENGHVQNLSWDNERQWPLGGIVSAMGGNLTRRVWGLRLAWYWPRQCKP